MDVDVLSYLAGRLQLLWTYMGTIYPFAANAVFGHYSLRELLVDSSVISLLLMYFTGAGNEYDQTNNFSSLEDD